MRIGNVMLPEGALLAPLAGFTDVGFRDVCRRYGAAMTYTEMISAKGMYYGSEKTRELLATTDIENPVAVQVFGSEPDMLARAAESAEFAKFNVIDINMGCPVPKIVRNGEGSALLNNPDLAYAIVRAVKNATDKPVSVKMRLGFNEGEFTAVELADAAERAGADAVALHGRTRSQFYSGRADWDKIKIIADRLNIPVIANGDVTCLDDYIKILEVTGAAGVMIGRGSLGNPSVFKDIAAHCGVNTIYTHTDIKRDMLRQIEVLSNSFSDRYVYSNMKKHVCYYTRGKSGAKAIKDRVCRVESVDELVRVIEECF